MNIMERYGASPDMMEAVRKEAGHELARVTAVHRERYELVSGAGNGFGRLKCNLSE